MDYIDFDNIHSISIISTMTTLDYMHPDSTATMREAIEELRAAEGAEGDMSETGELTPKMQPHDAVHVLFGCGTNLFGEVRAHMWMLLGTTARMAEMHQTATSKDHRSVLKDIGYLQLLSIWLRAVPAFVTIAFRSRRMNSKWPIDELPAFLDRRLSDIRAEYRIVV